MQYIVRHHKPTEHIHSGTDCPFILSVFSNRTDFVITASNDGHIKFWKKQEEGIEFVKHFRSHLGVIHSICTNYNGTLLCTVASDKAMKVFDVINFGKSSLCPIVVRYVRLPIFF